MIIDKRMLCLLLAVVMITAVSCGNSGSASSAKISAKGSSSGESITVSAPKMVLPKIIAEYPHDSRAYTQGLLFADGVLYESTGEYGQSSLRRIDIATGRVEQSLELPERYFAEGLALVGDSLLYQLTWQEQRCFVYRKSDFRQVGVFAYSGEGWGLTSNQASDSLYMSDGSSWIRVLDPKDFSQKRRFQVRDNNGVVDMVNELEWIEGRLWANLYLTERIAVIDPLSGRVTHYVDCAALGTRIKYDTGTDVFNGIAYDPQTGRIFVTGKNWDKLFEIEVVL